MKRGNSKIKTSSLVPSNLGELKVFESLIQSRIQYASKLGESYGGDRNTYQALGYKETLSFNDYLNAFKRGDIAKTLIEKLPKACWTNPPIVTDEKENSVFEKAYEELVKQFSLYSLLFRGDKLMRLGEYSILFLGFNDALAGDVNTEVIPSNSLRLLYIQSYSDQSAKVHTIEEDTSNPRFGLPKIYQISITSAYNSLTGSKAESTKTVLVHYSRIIHLIEDPLENGVEGTPYLECIYNRLQDIQKVLGGSAEMFWRNGVPGKVAKADENHTMDTTSASELQTQFDEYEHNLRRFLTTQGVEIKNLETSISDPSSFLDVQLNIIAIVSGIPKRILMGTERGELASSQDQNSWNALINTRQEEECEPVFLRPLIDRLIEFKILPEPTSGDYMIVWPALTSIGEKDKAEISKTRMGALKEYVSAPGADMLLPPDIFLRDEMGYNQDQIDEIHKSQSELPPIEEDDLEGDLEE